MSLTVTLALLVASIAGVAFCGWRGARAPDLMRGPRLVPWRFLMLLFATLTFLLLIHLAALPGEMGSL